jgi:hypothetical protein
LDALKPETAALLDGERHLHTVARMPIPYAQTERQPAIATHPKTEQHLLEISTAIFAVSVRWSGGPRRFRLVLIGALEGKSRRVLMQPGGREGRDLERLERDRPKNPVEMGGTQRIEEVSSPVSMQRGTGSPRLQQRHHAPLCQPAPHLLEGMLAIEHGEHQGFDPTPTREPVRRMGREETVEHRGHLPAS